jgi:hypothetical protein
MLLVSIYDYEIIIQSCISFETFEFDHHSFYVHIENDTSLLIRLKTETQIVYSHTETNEEFERV